MTGAGGPPGGTITMLFTDIEGSTQLLHALGDAYVQVLAEHRAALRGAFSAHHGVEVDTQGDAFFVAFGNADDAVAAARDIQRALVGHPVRVRVGVHTGEPTLTREGYVGIDVHRGARICAAGHGGQVLLSRSTRALLPPEIELRDLGEHRLKDLRDPEWLFQLVSEGLEHEFPPLRSLSNTNLPTAASALIGRAREVDELRALLARDDVRLLTLTGPGGIGKTRLAVRLAAEFVEQFRNGVFLVPLAPVTDAERVLPTVGQTVGANMTGVETPAAVLRRYLEGKSMLLVLDNFEQVIAAAPDVAALLSAAPRVKVVVTSRERLHLDGEHEYAVSPLPEDDAVALFDDRARTLVPSFRLADERDAVVAVCRRLDDLPLAIELAAARVKLFAPRELLARLERRLPLLIDGARDLPARQRTLRATIDWSYALLEPRERSLFTGLGVFLGGFRADAAEAVCGATPDDLGALLDKSLLLTREESDGERSFGVLETLREYALDRARADSSYDALRERHAAHYASRAAVEGGRTEGGRRPAAPPRGYAGLLSWLARERENLTAALEWAVERGQADRAIALVANVWRLWVMRGPLRDGRQWTERVLGMKDIRGARDFASLLFIASEFPRFQGDYVRARALQEEGLALARMAGDMGRIASYLETLASVVGKVGERALAKTLHDESLTLARELADPFRIGHALNGLAVLAFQDHDYAAMARFAEEELALMRQVEGGQVPASLHNLGEALQHLGTFDRSAALYLESLVESRKLGDADAMAEDLDGLADVAAAMDDSAAAVRLWAASQRLFNLNEQPQWDPASTERGISAARATLGDAAFDDAWAAGRALSDDAAVAAAQRIAVAAHGRAPEE